MARSARGRDETRVWVQQLIASRAQNQRERDLQSWQAKEAIKLKREESGS